MSFEQYHVSLGKNALDQHILEMQLILSNCIRQLASTVEHPNAITIGHKLIGLTHNLICKTHARYVLGQGPKATRLLDQLVYDNPNRERKSLFEEGVKPLLPQYRQVSEEDKDKDRSTNRHWATMARVGFGADQDNRWNHEVLDQWYDEGRIMSLSDFSQKKELLELPGARLLRGVSGDQHFYCVRVITNDYNKNMLTLAEGSAMVDAAVYVELEDIWATHDDCGLIEDSELEGYITELLKLYGVDETPLPVIETEIVEHEDNNEIESPEAKEE